MIETRTVYNNPMNTGDMAPTNFRNEARPRQSTGSESSSMPAELALHLIQTNSLDNYQKVGVLGTGAYGTVYKARSLEHEGKIVAMKKFKITLTEDGIPMSTLREISLLKGFENFEHPNIVRLYDICQDGTILQKESQLYLFLVFEYVEQDLSQYMAKCPSPGLGPDRIKDILFQLLCGVDFLHSNRVVHRDLKPQNLLITNSGEVKLADFGLSRIYDTQTVFTSVVVTLWYRSPEVLLQSSYATPVDVWSCGCIFAELFNMKALFNGQSETDQLVKIFEILGVPEEHEWPENVAFDWRSFRNYRRVPLEQVVPEICPLGKDLLEKMLIFDPKRRVTAKDAKNHQYFTEDNMASVERKKIPHTPFSSPSSSIGSSSNSSTPSS